MSELRFTPRRILFGLGFGPGPWIRTNLHRRASFPLPRCKFVRRWVGALKSSARRSGPARARLRPAAVSALRFLWFVRSASSAALRLRAAAPSKMLSISSALLEEAAVPAAGRGTAGVAFAVPFALAFAFGTPPTAFAFALSAPAFGGALGFDSGMRPSRG